MNPNITYINKSQDVPLKVILGFLILIFIIGIVLLIIFETEHSNCKNKESPICLTGNCAGQSQACQNAPFKLENEIYICKASLVNQQNIPKVQFSTP
jgi:hypothetical protein